MSDRVTDRNIKTDAKSLVVFASGRGSNFRALCQAVRAGALSARIAALVCNVEGAGAVGVAKEFGIPAFVVENTGLTRAAHEAKILEHLSKIAFDWVVLAGYMRLFTPEFAKRFQILNIHPSLLPAFPGKDGYAQALAYGVKVTGATVHFVGEGLDDGPIVSQGVLEVRDSDTEETLTERGLKLEHELYVGALNKLLTCPWRIQGRRVVF